MFCFANKKILNRPTKFSIFIEQMLELNNPVRVKTMLLAELANPQMLPQMTETQYQPK